MKKQGKILCLHGLASNKDILKYQLKQIQRLFDKNFQFVYLQGQHQIQIDEIRDDKLKKMIKANQQQAFSYILFKKDLSQNSVYEFIRPIIDIINNEGPFDGILGYCQGGEIINAYLQYVFQQKIPFQNVPKFYILINTNFQYKDIQQMQINLPSLHLLNEQNQNSLYLTTFYKQSSIIIHKEGEKMPKLNPNQMNIIKNFIVQNQTISRL